MICIILQAGSAGDNEPVATVLDLNELEHLNLWLESLVVFHRESGVYLSSQKALPENHNFREDLRGTCSVSSEITLAIPGVLRRALAELPRPLETEKLSEGKLREIVRRHPIASKELSQLLDLWEFVLRYQVIGAGLLKNSQFSRPELKAYTAILAGEVRRYCETDCHQTLLRRFHLAKVHHMILRDILLEIDTEGIREELTRVFSRFFTLLGVVSYFQGILSRSFQVHKLNILLVYSHSCTQSLIRSLDQASDYLDYCTPELAQGLAPVKFGLRVEFRNIFKRELKQVETEESLEERFSQIENAIGQLKQTAEEAFVSLVHHFNPDFDEEQLFVDKRQRSEDSSRLQHDLKSLYKLIVALVDDPNDEGFGVLAKRLAEFRKGSMRALFYKDWRPLEKFSQEMAGVEPDERAFLLHRFEVYVSTLLGEVSKRSVLTKAIPHSGSQATGS